MGWTDSDFSQTVHKWSLTSCHKLLLLHFPYVKQNINFKCRRIRKQNKCKSEVLFKIFWCHHWLLNFSLSHFNSFAFLSVHRTDTLGRCRLGVNLIDFHYPQSGELWQVIHTWSCRQTIKQDSTTLYLTLLPIPIHSMHKDSRSDSYYFTLPFHGYQRLCRL